VPRYEELRLNSQRKPNAYRSRSRTEQSKNNLAKPLVFAVFIIIIFAIIFSIVKTYGPSASIAFKDFFRIPQPEAIFSEVSATILENEEASFLSTIPGFSFFVPSDDNEAIEIVADETNERIGARVRNESDEMIQEFASTSRITRDILAPFFNNVSSTLNDTITLGRTNTINDNLENQNIISYGSEVVESTTFDELLKPRTENYDRTKMKPAYTRRYTENDSKELVFETNIYAKPIIKERDKFIEYTDGELEKNRKEFYNIDDNAEEVSVREITEAPKGRVVESTQTPKNYRETVNISDNIVPPRTKDTILPKKNTLIEEDVQAKDTILPIEKTVTPKRATPSVTRPKENIIVPSPMPEFVINNNNQETILPKKDNLIEEDVRAKDTVLPKEKTVTPKRATPSVTRAKENIIVPSPLPKFVINNNNQETILPTKDNLIEEDIRAKDTVLPKEKTVIPKRATPSVTRPRNNIIVPSPMPESIRNDRKIEAPVEDILPKENVVTPKTRDISPKKEIETVTRAKENIIVPSPLPESVINNNNNQVERPKENNNLEVRKRDDSLAQNNETIVDSNNNPDFRNVITNETYSPTEYPKEKSTVTRVPSSGVDNVVNYNNAIKSGIFLVEYDENAGTITLVFKERDIDRDSFTLEKAILTLLEGATDIENNDNIISIIPKNVELLDIFREDNTVYLNFSSDFEYNAIGNEGMLVQLYQFVYTATQFDGIDNVVFLIEGKYNEFIGAEGSIVNSPFQRLVRDDNVLIDTLK